MPGVSDRAECWSVPVGALAPSFQQCLQPRQVVCASPSKSVSVALGSWRSVKITSAPSGCGSTRTGLWATSP